MGFLIPRKYGLLFLVISASLISASAGGRSKFLNDNSAEQLGGAYHKESSVKTDEAEGIEVHERLLWMNAHDYGRYNPTPRLRKPRFKLIPN